MSVRKQKKIVWDLEYLHKYCKEKNVILVGTYNKVTVETKIRGLCITPNCDNEFHKKFRSVLKSGPYCRTCIGKTAEKKRIETNLQKRGVASVMQDPKVKETHRRTCQNNLGVEFVFQSQEFKDKRKETLLDTLGVEHPFQSSDIKEKREKTNIAKRGVPHVAQDPTVIEKGKQTNLQKRGVVSSMQDPEVKANHRQSCKNNFGVEFVFQSQEFKDKREKTNIARRGVPHVAQDPEVLAKIQKSAFKNYDYILPSKNIIVLQGYEHFALDELVTFYPEDDIITGVENVPEITYVTDDGHQHSHFPDIYLEDENMIIEVKAPYTLKVPNVFLKMHFAIEQGYGYEIWEFTSKGEKTVHDINGSLYKKFLEEYK